MCFTKLYKSTPFASNRVFEALGNALKSFQLQTFVKDGDSVCTNPPRLQRNCFRRFVDLLQLLQYILTWTTGTTDHFLYVLQGSQVSRWTKVCAKIIICCCSVRIFENHCGAVANGDDGMAYQSSGTCCSSSAEHKVLAQTVFLQASSCAFLWQQRTAAHGH